MQVEVQELDRIIRGKDFKHIHQMLDFIAESEEIKRRKEIKDGSLLEGKNYIQFYIEKVLEILKKSEVFE